MFDKRSCGVQLLSLIVFAIAPVAASASPTAHRQTAAMSSAGNARVQDSDGSEDTPLDELELPDNFKVQPGLARKRREVDAKAEAFARCLPHFDMALLSKVIDGKPYQTSTRAAFGRLIQTNAACYPNAPVSGVTARKLGSCNPTIISGDNSGSDSALAGLTSLGSASAYDEGYGGYGLDSTVQECRVAFDRGAILRSALARYAPDLELTPDQTDDADVQARLNRREVPRNNLRDKSDQLFFQVAICMVRMEPELSMQLSRPDIGYARQYELEDKLVSGARDCIGGAKQVGADPIHFRNYITDAVYRWGVAAKGVDVRRQNIWRRSRLGIAERWPRPGV